MENVALITGGTDGIGKEVVGLLFARNPATRFLIVSRRKQKFEILKAAYPDIKADFLQYDLSLMRKGVQACIEDIKSRVRHLDIVVHCAGVVLRRRTLTEEDLETVFALQYLARQKMSLEIMDLLQKSPQKGRMVNVSAGGMFNLKIPYDNLMGEKFYNGSLALIRESVANDMLVLELADRSSTTKHYCYGPFLVITSLLRNMDPVTRFLAYLGRPCVAISPLIAAEDVMTLLDLSANYPSGLYGRKAKPSNISAYKEKNTNRHRLIDHCEEIIAGVL